MAEITTVEHLTRVIGLCQLPIESWTTHDRAILQEARKHIQKEKDIEVRITERNSRVAAVSEEEQDGKEIIDEV